MFLGILFAISGVFSWKPLVVRYRIARAKQALIARDGEEAILWLKPNPLDDAETQFWLARAHRRLGRYDKVREHLERAWKLGYSIEKVKREQLLAYAQSGQLKQAEPHLPKLLQDPKDDAREICEAYVAGYLLHHRADRALPILDAWQQDFPEDAYPYLIRGRILEGTHNGEKAIQNYRKSIELDPKKSEARFRLASLLMNRHEYDEAGSLLKHCLDNDPDNPDFITGWSEWLSIEGRTNEARESLAHALKIHPAHQNARMTMGKLELSSGNPDLALRWLQPIAEEVPHDASVRYLLARALQRAGNSKEAAEHFEFVDAAGVAMSKVQVLIEQLAQDPRNVNVRFEIGANLMKFGDPREAVFWLQSVLELNPQHRQTHELLAKHYGEKGPMELAMRHRKRAEELRKRTDGNSVK